MAPAKLTDRSTITRITRIKRPRSLARTTRFVETNQAVSTCPVPIQKIFPFPSDANHLRIFRHPVPQRGGSRSLRTRGRMRWTRHVKRRMTLRADGEVVWSRRPDAGVKLAKEISPVMVARKPGHQGEREGNR